MNAPARWPTTDFSHSPSASTSENTFNLTEIYSALWLGKWRIGFSTIIALCFGVIWAIFGATPQYMSIAVVVLDSTENQLANISNLLPSLSGNSTAANTEVEILRSRKVVLGVVETLDLTADPEFNMTLRKPSLVQSAWVATAGRLGLPDLFPTTEINQKEVALTSTHEALRHKVNVRNVPDTLVFEIVVVTSNATKSAQIANAFADQYTKFQISSKFEAAEQATSWLSVRVAELKLELEALDSKVNHFAAQTELISAESLEGLSRQLKVLRERTTQAGLALQNVEQAEGTTPDQRAPEVVRAQSQFAALTLASMDLEAKLSAQSTDYLKLEQLKREAEASRVIYEYFLSRMKETSVQQGIQQAESRVLSEAVASVNPSSPKYSLVFLMAAFIGTIVGASFVLVKEARTSNYRTAEALEQETGTRVLGQIPLFPSRRRAEALRYIAQNPTSLAAEAVRNFRTSVLLANEGPNPQVIMSTSSVPEEGKTTQSLTLALSMAGLGKKVLVMECDIRRSVIGSYFGTDMSGKLVAAIKGSVTLAEAVSHEAEIGVDILRGERPKESAADLFSSVGFADLIKEARETYDCIVLDTPPVLVVPDGRIIGHQADAIIYSVRWDKTPRSQVRQGLYALSSVGLETTGLVLSQIDTKGMKRYGYHDQVEAAGYYHG